MSRNLNQDNSFTVSCTSGQKKEWHKKALAHGMKLSTFVRFLLSQAPESIQKGQAA